MAEVMVAQGAEEEASEEVVLGQMEVVLNVRFLANLFIPCGREVFKGWIEPGGSNPNPARF